MLSVLPLRDTVLQVKSCGVWAKHQDAPGSPPMAVTFHFLLTKYYLFPDSGCVGLRTLRTLYFYATEEQIISAKYVLISLIL